MRRFAFVLAMVGLFAFSDVANALPNNGRGPIGRFVAARHHTTVSTSRSKAVVRTTSAGCATGNCATGSCANGKCLPAGSKFVAPSPLASPMPKK